MLFIGCICIISASFGAIIGKWLAGKKITAANAINNYQREVYVIVSAIVVIFSALFLINSLKLNDSIFNIILIYVAEYINYLVLALGCFSLGLLVLLEWEGRRDRQRLREMLIAVFTIMLAISIIIHYSLPVNALVGNPKIADGIVLQTTRYTCAPASIATLANLMGIQPPLTEKDVVAMTNTNKFGTSVLAEIRTMEKLGMSPQYKRGLNITDLINNNKLAILHVNEPIRGKKMNHAIALLGINPNEQTVTVGNPIYGIQIKTFEEMEDYWTGDAVFVNHSRNNRIFDQ